MYEVDALKAMYLVPRTPSPVPLEDRPIEELTFEERGELLRRQRVSDYYSAGNI